MDFTGHLSLNSPGKSLFAADHGHLARPPVRTPGENRGAAPEGRADRRTGTGARPERRAHPEAAERAGQIPFRHQTRNPTGPEADGAAGAPADQETGNLG